MEKQNKLIIHYNEIATKGKNRGFFENTLIKNIKNTIKNQITHIDRLNGKFIFTLKINYDKETLKDILKKIPGISQFAFAFESSLELKEIEKTSLNILKKADFKTFKVTTKRTNKKYYLKSPEVNAKIGEAIFTKLNKTVSMKNPELELFIEISEKNSFVYSKKHKGLGGLPTGTIGKVISSLSGGIDSPVASFLIMKRGAKVILAHMHNKNINSKATLNKIELLAKQLSKFQGKTKLCIIPFDKIQKEIIAYVPEDLRMIIYRRFMNKILNLIAKKENAKAIITGDNLGQVASQTLENLQVIHESSTLPIFSPLIGLNKQEIIDIAKQINTYEISILPYEDCCSFLIAKRPKTKSKLDKVKNQETLIEKQENLINEAVEKTEVKEFKP